MEGGSVLGGILADAPEGVNRALPWTLLYMAIFLIRPWERLYPSLQAVALEKVIALVVLVRVVVGKGNRFKMNRAVIGTVAFLFCIAVATAMSCDPGVSWIELSKVLKYSVYAACILMVCNKAKDLRAWTTGWVLVMAAYQAKSLWEYAFHGRGVYRMGFWRLIGIEDTYSDPNTLAAKTILVLPFLVVALRLEKRNWMKIVLGLAFLQAMAVVVLTGSRAGMIACAVFIVLTLATTSAHWKALAVLGVLVGMTIVMLPKQIALRYETLVDPKQNEAAYESAMGRWKGFVKGIELFQRRPVTGVGPGVFPRSHLYVGRLRGELIGLQPHNLAGQVLGETGAVGAIGLIVLLGTLFSACWVVRRGGSRQRKRPWRRPPPGLSAPETHAEQVTDLGIVREIVGAAAQSLVLMLVFGIPGHNLYEYNWFWLAAVIGAGEWIYFEGSRSEVSRPA